MKLYFPSIPHEEFLEDKHWKTQYGLMVQKSNEFVRETTNSLTLCQQKMLCYMITQLNDNDTVETVKEFDIKTFYNIMGINSNDYEGLKKDLRALDKLNWWYTEDNGDDVLYRFFYSVRISKRSGKVAVRFHGDILPHLQQLKKCYTSYKLFYIMTLRSQYSFRLYELLKSVAGKKMWYFSLNNLKQLLNCIGPAYDRIDNFKKRIIEPAIDEINEKTDINVTYSYHRECRKFVGIEFTITEKSIPERLKVDKTIKSLTSKNYE